MTETRLRAFADDAVLLVDVPDLASLERRGRDLRARRRTAVVALGVVLAVLGGWLVQDRTARADPDTVDTPARAWLPYPGNEMHTLPAGTYELFPSATIGDPTALLTLPSGWNNWEGPNRFDGHRPEDPTEGRYNEPALERSTWYVGVLVLKILALTNDLCMETDRSWRFVETYDDTVRAFDRIPGYRRTSGPTPTEAFGRPATYFHYRGTREPLSCTLEADVYLSAANGSFGGMAEADIWVVDVDGVPLTVIVSKTGGVPARNLEELEDVVGSIEFVTHEGE